MNSHSLRLRTIPMIVLAGIMIATSLIAASPAAAAKAQPSMFAFCVANGPQTTPGYPLQCSAGVGGFPAPTGTLKLAASSYKGLLSTKTCPSVTSCNFTYVPMGKGSDYRKDTIYVNYSGDANYYSGSTKIVIFVAKSPPAVLNFSCPASAQTGATAVCSLSFQLAGFSPSHRAIALSAPSYKGTVAPEACSPFFGNCTVLYTPKGRAYDTRVDKITASYPGDLYNSPAKVTESIQITP